MVRRIRRVGAALVLVGAVSASLAACRTPIVQAACDGKLISTTTGTLKDPALIEASGLASSARNPGTLWANNDSGDTARLFAITESGTTRAIYTLAGANALDWEDIALGRGPVAGRPYLYAGDIGDNYVNRPDVAVYRVAEPLISGSGAQTLTGVDKLTLRYPDGAKDAEALMVDPRTGELFVIQKSYSGGPVGIYRAPADLPAGSTTVMTRVGALTLPSGLGNAVTSADISPDGNSVIVRTYGGVHLWNRASDQTLVASLAGAECPAPVPAEGQGESVAFRADNRAYFTVSEGGSAALHRYEAPTSTP